MGCPRCPLYLRDSPTPVTQGAGFGLLLRWIGPGACAKVDLSPVGSRQKVCRLGDACQSFCLSVQTAAISNPAPSAASARAGSLLTGQILQAARDHRLVDKTRGLYCRGLGALYRVALAKRAKSVSAVSICLKNQSPMNLSRSAFTRFSLAILSEIVLSPTINA